MPGSSALCRSGKRDEKENEILVENHRAGGPHQLREATIKLQ
jgi:hypothetical protein